MKNAHSKPFMMKKPFHLMSNSMTNLSIIGGSIKGGGGISTGISSDANLRKQAPHSLRKSSDIAQHWVFLDDEGS
jgi:hypothetical protein